MIKKMSNPEIKAISGVLAGLAYQFKMDPFWIRLIFVLFLLSSFGTLFVVYFIMAFIMEDSNISKDEFEAHISSTPLN